MGFFQQAVPHAKSAALPLVVCSVIACAVGLAVSPLPLQLRFQHPAANYWFASALAIALPCSIAWSAARFRRRWLRMAGLFVALLVAIPCGVFSLFALADAPEASSTVDPSFELIDQASPRGSAYRLYRTDCGATCSFGLALRREVDLLAGLKVVTPLWSQYRESEARLGVTSTHVQVLQGTKVLWESPL
jgi:hypothetical protein